MKYFFTEHALFRLREFNLTQSDAEFFLRTSHQPKTIHSNKFRRYKYKKHNKTKNIEYFRSNGFQFVISKETSPKIVITVVKIA